jgi:hypothetical protein
MSEAQDEEGDEDELDLVPPAPEWPRVITLRHQFDFGKRRIESITIRRGKLGDLKGLRLSETIPADQLVLVASRMTGEPVAVIEKLEDEDAGDVIGVVLSFFEKCLHGGR